MLKIKELRENLNLTQRELAEKINTTNKNIWAYENGLAQPSIDTLIKLSNFFEVSIDYLVGRTEDEDNVVVISSDNKLSHREQRLLSAFNKLTDMAKEKLIEDAEFYANNYDKILK